MISPSFLLYLNWEDVCRQVPEIRRAYDDSNLDPELSYSEFIVSAPLLYEMAAKWWKSLPNQERRDLLQQHRDRLAKLVSVMDEELERDHDSD